jgi:hypothetical protein
MKLFFNVGFPTPGWNVPGYWKTTRRQFAAVTIREIRSQLRGHRKGGFRGERKTAKAERVAAATAEAKQMISAWLDWVKVS